MVPHGLPSIIFLKWYLSPVNFSDRQGIGTWTRPTYMVSVQVHGFEHWPILTRYGAVRWRSTSRFRHSTRRGLRDDETSASFLSIADISQVHLHVNRWYHPKYVARSFDESLHKLGLDYVDLVVLHAETNSDDRLICSVVPSALAPDWRVPE
jgi:hypothetical protein